VKNLLSRIVAAMGSVICLIGAAPVGVLHGRATVNPSPPPSSDGGLRRFATVVPIGSTNGSSMTRRRAHWTPPVLWLRLTGLVLVTTNYVYSFRIGLRRLISGATFHSGDGKRHHRTGQIGHPQRTSGVVVTGVFPAAQLAGVLPTSGRLMPPAGAPSPESAMTACGLSVRT
jgi:hypothetical protein